MKFVFALSLFFAVCTAWVAEPCFAQTDEYVVVANKAQPGDTINKAVLKGIYLREVRNWGSGGGEIVPVDLNSAADFYQDLFQKSYVQMQAYWLNMRIKYSVSLPVTKKDADAVKAFVASNKDAIGFLKSSEADDRVKVLKPVN